MAKKKDTKNKKVAAKKPAPKKAVAKKTEAKKPDPKATTKAVAKPPKKVTKKVAAKKPTPKKEGPKSTTSKSTTSKSTTSKSTASKLAAATKKIAKATEQKAKKAMPILQPQGVVGSIAAAKMYAENAMELNQVLPKTPEQRKAKPIAKKRVVHKHIDRACAPYNTRNKKNDNAKIHCYTSFTFSYLAKAKVLAATIKKHCPNYKFWALITDVPPEGFSDDLNLYFDEVVYADELPIENIKKWFYEHNIVEVCTAVKGMFIDFLLSKGCSKVIYLDPDVAAFDNLDSIAEMLDKHSVVLTPHQLTPEKRADKMAIIDNEICSLKHGTYNLGFVAVKNDKDGREYAAWWRDRLLDFCYDDIPNGLFTDQKWNDLVPAMFDNVFISRYAGYNVASWNLSQRTIKITEQGQILVNGVPLKFFHFTKLGPVGDLMTQRYAKENIEVYEIWRWYKDSIAKYSDNKVPKGYWHYGTYENGEKITDPQRELYRTRVDLQNAFPNPYEAEGNCYLNWYKANGDNA